MNTEQLAFYVGPRDQDGRRTVIASAGGKNIHRDHFNTDSAFLRTKFVDALTSTISITPALPTDEEMATYTGGQASQQTITGTLEQTLLERADEADKEQLTEEAGPLAYEILTAADLDDGEYHEEWHIEGVLVARQPMIVAAPSKGMKTTVLLAMAISLAMGVSFLGKFRIPRAVRVLFFSAESGLSTLQKTARAIAIALGFGLSDVGGFFVCPQAPQLTSAIHLEAIRRAIREREAEVLILDPVYLMLDTAGAENSIFAMGAHLADVNAVCQEEGCTLILVNHCKKNGLVAGEPLDLSAIAWSGFEQFARQWLLLSRREPYQPDVPGVHKLWAAIGGSAGHSSLWGLDIDEWPHDARRWQVDVLPAADIRHAKEGSKEQAKAQKAEQQVERDCNALVTAAARFPGGETLKAIREAAGVSGTRSQLALRMAIDAGALVPCNVMKSGRRAPYEGYKLASGDTSS